MSKSSSYNELKISKQRSIGHIKHESHMIIKIVNNLCVRNNEECFNNGTSVCHGCAIYCSDTRLEILFRASPWKVPDILTEKIKLSLTPNEQQSIIKEPVSRIAPSPIEEVKIITPPEDEYDKLTKVVFICESITHIHSGNLKDHTHYPTYNNIMQGSSCHVCNYNPIYGRNLCPQCEQIYFEE